MAWSWHFTPMRLYTDKRFLRLSKVDEPAANLLLRLYSACDRWGRGPHDDLAIGVRTGLVAAADIVDRLERLYDTGLILRSEDGESWELERYDEDAPRDVKRDRPPSEYPPGKAQGPREKSGESPGSIRGVTGEHPGDHRNESAHARAHAAARAQPPGRQGKARQGREEERAPAAPPACAPAPTRVHARDQVPPPSPAPPRIALDPRAIAARDRWLAHLSRVAPTFSIAAETIDAIAADYAPEVFVRAVEDHFDADPKWWRHQPVGSLRKRCDWALEPSSSSPSRAPPPAASAPKPPSQPLPRACFVKADNKPLDAYALGTATPEQRAHVEAAMLYVREAGVDERGRERPFLEWPEEIREEALGRVRKSIEARRPAVAAAQGPMP